MTSQTAKMIVRNIGNTLTRLAELQTVRYKGESERYNDSIPESFSALLDDRERDPMGIKDRLAWCLYLADGLGELMFEYERRFFTCEERSEMLRAYDLLKIVRVDDNGVFSLDY